MWYWGCHLAINYKWYGLLHVAKKKKEKKTDQSSVNCCLLTKTITVAPPPVCLWPRSLAESHNLISACGEPWLRHFLTRWSILRSDHFPPDCCTPAPAGGSTSRQKSQQRCWSTRNHRTLRSSRGRERSSVTPRTLRELICSIEKTIFAGDKIRHRVTCVRQTKKKWGHVLKSLSIEKKENVTVFFPLAKKT